jgi:hypothetical protein
MRSTSPDNQLSHLSAPPVVAPCILTRCAGAIVADQLGPGKLRGVPPEWGAFASLAALVATALAPVYRQVRVCSCLRTPARVESHGTQQGNGLLLGCKSSLTTLDLCGDMFMLASKLGAGDLRLGLTGSSTLCVVTGGKLCALI